MLKMLRRSIGLLLWAAALNLLPSGVAVAGESAAAPLIFAGSGTNLPITQLLAEAFRHHHPAVAIEVPTSIGSTGAVRAAAVGAIGLGLISRPLKPQEKALGLTSVPYARTAVVIGVHPTVMEDAITFDDLIQIYQGTKTRWSDGREIVVLTREPGDSSNEVLEQVIPGFKEVYAESHQAKRWATMFKDQEMNQALAKKPYAIGLSDMGAITTEQLPIKALQVNGVPPAAEDVRSGRYLLVKTLYFTYLPEKLPAEAKAFLDFVRSSEGAQILQANGYLPGE
jgi:phosphate transport system substrate-binding protein